VQIIRGADRAGLVTWRVRSETNQKRSVLTALLRRTFFRTFLTGQTSEWSTWTMLSAKQRWTLSTWTMFSAKQRWTLSTWTVLSRKAKMGTVHLDNALRKAKMDTVHLDNALRKAKMDSVHLDNALRKAKMDSVHLDNPRRKPDLNISHGIPGTSPAPNSREKSLQSRARHGFGLEPWFPFPSQ